MQVPKIGVYTNPYSINKNNSNVSSDRFSPGFGFKIATGEQQLEIFKFLLKKLGVAEDKIGDAIVGVLRSINGDTSKGIIGQNDPKEVLRVCQECWKTAGRKGEFDPNKIPNFNEMEIMVDAVPNKYDELHFFDINVKDQFKHKVSVEYVERNSDPVKTVTQFINKGKKKFITSLIAQV